METSNVLQLIGQHVVQLRGKGAIGVDQYEQKLKNNVKNKAVLCDLFLEGRAALLFLNNGFIVTFRDSPDLRIELDNEVVYAEVKHFREKEQDRLDEKAMSETRGLSGPIGDTTATEGSEVWDQIVEVAISKADQYIINAPNILIIESSSDSASQTLPTAAHNYNGKVRETNDPRLRRLNALMLVNIGLVNIGSRNSGLYNIEFCPLYYVDTPMSDRLISALFNIRLG